MDRPPYSFGSRLAGAWLAIVLLTTPALAADPATQSSLERAIHNAVAGSIIDFDVPGAVAAVIMPDGEEIIVPVGCIDRACETLMPPDAIMRGGSTGKSYTAAIALDLALKGRLNLDTPVVRYLPDADWIRRLANGEKMTMRHLLTHSSGIGDWPKIPEAVAAIKTATLQDPDSYFSPLELIAFSFDRPGHFPPGEGFYYSDSGYLVAGLVIEAITGRDIFEQIEETFAEPLQLDDTTPQTTRSVPGLVSGHLAADNPRGLPSALIVDDGKLAYHPGYEWTGGGFYTSARDLARWGRAYCNGDALEGDYWKVIRESLVEWNASNDYSFGLIFSDDDDYGLRCSHRGWTPGYLSEFRHYPEYNVTIGIQLNGTGKTDFSNTAVRGPWPQLTTRAVQDVLSAAGIGKPK
ncbi:MAG TPA: serine hydrolase domain-containing protein [Alphaproteobacteria bacterium]|nr:serine hydrolase domain-containing protein [Alphaproteobacteria bacterium]